MSGLPLMRAAVDDVFDEGQFLSVRVPATRVLVEALLDRGADADVGEAEAAIERLAAAPADEGLVIHEIWLLGCGLCWPGLTAMRRLQATCGIATATWQNAWLRGAYRVGRGDAMTAPGLVCGPCGTELPPNAKSYNESAVPELPGPVNRLAAAPCSGSTGFLVTVRQQPSQNVGAVGPERQC